MDNGNKMISRQLERGQIALIVLLIMVVVLTIGLSVASRSVTDIYLSESEQEGTRAFNAAEAGIEYVLSQPTLVEGTLSVPVGDITADVQIEELRSLEVLVARNDVVEVSLAGATTNVIEISWSKEDDSEQNPETCSEGVDQAPAALEITRLRRVGGNVAAYRYLYDTGKQGCSITNGLALASPGADGFVSEAAISGIDGSVDIALRIRTIYNKATVVVVPIDGQLPLQEYRILSTAQAESGETRTVELTRSVSGLPAVFDYAVFSGGSITK